ncbi:MAG: oligosaccharide flippase family protein, partial [Oceanospirillales bacterium]|nr:oligosaccharide flippase family protein [Oceanospirillales bacterium]
MILKKLMPLSLINIATACLTLIWVPILISVVGAESYGKFILIVTISSIIYSIIYINNWQWLLIKLEENKKNSVYVSIANDILYFLCILTIIFIIKSTAFISLSDEYKRLLCSYLIGFSISIQSIYVAYFRSINKFNTAALVVFFSELLKSSLIIFACYYYDSDKEIIGFLSGFIWIFGLPHIVLSFYSVIKLRDFIDLNGFFENFRNFINYNIYLHPKNISDLVINHFDKVIIKINLGYEALAVYDILKKIGYSISKLLSPIYPIVFRELVKIANDNEALRIYAGKTTKVLILISIGIYLSVEFLYFFRSLFINESHLLNKVIFYSGEARLYIICHLLGFSACVIHLILSALSETKKEFIITFI